MKYEYKETQLSSKYQSIYLELMRKNEEILCLIGADNRYRIVTRDSYYDNITDMYALLDLCLYPLYINGNIEVKNQLQELIKKMVASNDALQVFQVFNLIMSQEIEKRMYSNIPFEIDFSDIIKSLLNKKSEIEEEMKNYKYNGFERFNESIWICVERICKKSTTIKNYLANQ